MPLPKGYVLIENTPQPKLPEGYVLTSPTTPEKPTPLSVLSPMGIPQMTITPETLTKTGKELGGLKGFSEALHQPSVLIKKYGDKVVDKLEETLLNNLDPQQKADFWAQFLTRVTTESARFVLDTVAGALTPEAWALGIGGGAVVKGALKVPKVRQYLLGKFDKYLGFTKAPLEEVMPKTGIIPLVTPAMAKEPWKMTKQEYFEKELEFRRKSPEYKDKELWHGLTDKQILETQHKQIIQQAIANGESVPNKVIKSYPELAITPKINEKTISLKIKANVPLLQEEYDYAVNKMNLPQNVRENLAIHRPVPVTDISKMDDNQFLTHFTTTLGKMKTLRMEQQKLYTAERAKRFAEWEQTEQRLISTKGEEQAFYAGKSKMKGELAKIEFESIRNQIGGQEGINRIFRTVNDSKLNFTDKITAKNGLIKLLGTEGVGLPTEGELAVLDMIFPQNLVNTLLAKRPFLTKMGEMGLDLANIPRAIMSSGDISFGLRQGIFLAARYPKQFISSWLNQFKYLTSQKAYNGLMQEIYENPLYQTAKDNGLSLTNLGRFFGEREERFMSRLADRLPIVKQSNRAYTGFANKFRMDTFEHLIKKAEKEGLDPLNNPTLLKNVAGFINNATGRGELPSTLGLKESAAFLNSVFFSPKLAASRINLLNPTYYTKLDPFTRKEALMTLASYAGTQILLLTLAKMGGAMVETDPRSADFGKARFGKTRIDVGGGFSQYLTLYARLGLAVTNKLNITNIPEFKSSTTQKLTKFGAEGYKPLTAYDIAENWMSAKAQPVVSFAIELLKNQGFAGEKFNLKSAIAKRFIPMVIQDVYDLANEDPENLWAAPLSVMGVGVQTYGTKKK